jgi:hypothetical protein
MYGGVKAGIPKTEQYWFFKTDKNRLINKINQPKIVLLQYLGLVFTKPDRFLKLNRTNFVENCENQTDFVDFKIPGLRCVWKKKEIIEAANSPPPHFLPSD